MEIDIKRSFMCLFTPQMAIMTGIGWVSVRSLPSTWAFSALPWCGEQGAGSALGQPGLP